jgi:hypothetical protein
MEPLETRIARLTAEQQQEVGDFVDFLLLKNNVSQTRAVSQPSIIMVNTPPVMVPDPLPLPVRHSPMAGERDDPSRSPPLIDADPQPPLVHEIKRPDDERITRDYMDYGTFEETPPPAEERERRGKHRTILRKEAEGTRHLLEWVD